MEVRSVANNLKSLAVCATRSNFATRTGALHRVEAGRCSRAPPPAHTTDLATAAVDSDFHLCSHCEWPDGAEEVLQE